MFHAHNGWFFRRVPENGNVVIERHKTADENSPLIAACFFTPEMWASIVASVSIKGEADMRWYAALDFHMKESTWTCSRCGQVNPIEIKSGYLNECINCHVPILGTNV